MELRTEVEIEAPPGRVRQVLAGLDRYPEWNPFITRLSGTLERGAALGVTLGLADGRQIAIEATILVAQPDAELRWAWTTLHRRLFSAEHFFLLRAQPDGRTRFVQGANLDGVLAKAMGHTLTLATRGAVGMNTALKERAEGQAGSA